MNKLTTYISITAVLFAVILAFNSGRPLHPKTDKELASTAVMITNLRENSGGTGVILSSNTNESKIITNAHVCAVVKNGGVVHSNGQKALVSSFQVSTHHDLCLITVQSDLHISTEVASSAPDLFSSAAVAGFPALLPTIITRGHFSKKEFITVMTGVKACEAKDLEGPNAGLCIFLGGLPILKLYEAQVVSPTIMPGSSGSSIWNSDGKISGLIFAGAGQIGYGHAVPQEYVKYFIDHEVKNLEDQFPAVQSTPDLSENANKKLRNTCKDGVVNLNYNTIKEFCEYINTDLVY